MPRDSAGNYSLPLPPVVAGQTVEANWANTTLADMAAEFTDSLSRSGKGGMNSDLKFADGTVAAPGMAWTAEAQTGLYRAASGDMRVSILGQDVMRWNASGTQVWTGAAFRAVLTDADADGSTYARKDNTWVVTLTQSDIEGNYLNIDGSVDMTGDLGMGNNKVKSIADGTDPTDAVSKSQLDTVDTKTGNNATAITALDGRVTTNEGNISTNASGISTNASAITALDGRVTTNEGDISTNASGVSTNSGNIAANTSAISGLDTRVTDLENAGVPDPVVAQNFRSNGNIRHLMVDHGSGNATIVVSSATRHIIDNNGNLTITVNGEISASDPDLGNTVREEVSISIFNGGSPGTISLSGLTNLVEIGEQSTDASVRQVLTILIDRRAGTNYCTAVWSN